MKHIDLNRYCPSHFRLGQFLSNFLDWLRHTKGIYEDDLFYTPDEKLEQLLIEFADLLAFGSNKLNINRN